MKNINVILHLECNATIAKVNEQLKNVISDCENNMYE